MQTKHVLGLSVFLLLLGMSVATTPEIDISEDNQCTYDNKAAEICLNCSRLPFNNFASLSSCCSDKEALLFCEACINNENSCNTLLNEIEDVKELSEDNNEDYDSDYDYFDSTEDYNGEEEIEALPSDLKTVPDKRYGRLFVNKSPKRYGRVFFGKRSDKFVNNYGNLDKRYGRLYLGGGSYFGKKDEMAKRYGSLFMNSRFAGKRVPPTQDANLDLYDLRGYVDDDLPNDKRFGRVFVSGRMLGSGLFNREGTNKRYGRLFVSRNKMFGKRTVTNDGYPNRDKRFGILYLGSNRSVPSRYVHRNKRYGRLFMGRKKYYFG